MRYPKHFCQPPARLFISYRTSSSRRCVRLLNKILFKAVLQHQLARGERAHPDPQSAPVNNARVHSRVRCHCRGSHGNLPAGLHSPAPTSLPRQGHFVLGRRSKAATNPTYLEIAHIFKPRDIPGLEEVGGRPVPWPPSAAATEVRAAHPLVPCGGDHAGRPPAQPQCLGLCCTVALQISPCASAGGDLWAAVRVRWVRRADARQHAYCTGQGAGARSIAVGCGDGARRGRQPSPVFGSRDGARGPADEERALRVRGRLRSRGAVAARFDRSGCLQSSDWVRRNLRRAVDAVVASWAGVSSRRA